MANDLEADINRRRGVNQTSAPQQDAGPRTFFGLQMPWTDTRGSGPTREEQARATQNTPLGKQIAANPYPTLPPNPSAGDYLHNITAQLERGGSNVARVAQDAFTRGFGDRLEANNQFTPTDVEAERAKTEQASQELGYGGNLGVRTMAQIPVRIFRTGSLLKSGIEGGVSGAADAWGHGGSWGDVVSGGLTGFGTGSGLTAATQGAGQLIRKGLAASPTARALYDATRNFIAPNTLTPKDVTQVATADANAKFNQLDQNQYNPNHVGNVADQVHDQTFNNDPIRMTGSPGTHGILSDFRKDIWQKAANGQPATAGDIHTQIKSLGDVIKRGGQDGADAANARDFLINSFGNLPPLNNTAPNVMAQFRAANEAHAVQKNAEMLQGMNENLGAYGTMPGPQAKSALENQPGFYQGPGQKQAMQDIATSGQGGTPTIGSLIGTGGTGAGVGYFTGYHALGPLAAGADLTRAVSTPAAARRAVYDAYPALTGETALRNPEEMASRAAQQVGLGVLSQTNQGKPNIQDMIPGPLKPYVYPLFGQ